jgi:hypothetical protein
MANALEELLASSEQVTKTAGGTAAAQVPEYYPVDMLWAVAARAVTSIDGAKMYEGRDANQLAFISTTPPRSGGRNRKRAGQVATQQVTIYKSGSVTFNNVDVIDIASLTVQEVAAGQLLAHQSGQVKLTPAEVSNFQAIVSGETVPSEDED